MDKDPDKIWASDITYIKTKKGCLFLCVVLDLFSRKVIGWSMGIKAGSNLVIKILKMAKKQRNAKEKLLFHSDQGVQYTSFELCNYLRKNRIIQSFSRRGNCWDNAVAESFFKSLKIEEVYYQKLKTI